MERLEDIYENDHLSDNRGENYYQQCRKCKLNNDGTVYSNSYDKACCVMFPYPDTKPIFVMDNQTRCPYRTV